MAPVATMRKSRRVGSPWAPDGMVLEAIAYYIPRGVTLIDEKAPLFQGSDWSQASRKAAATGCRIRRPFATRTAEGRKSMRLALYRARYTADLGAFIRLAACLGTPLDIIEPVAFRSTTSASAGPPWIIPTWHSSAGMTPGPLSGATARPAGWSCSPRRAPPSCRQASSGPTTPCCSAARAPACRPKSTPPPIFGSACPCRRARGRSMSRWPRQWY